MKQNIGDLDKPRFVWRQAYDQKRDELEGDLAATRCEDPSLTVQSFTEDADVNTIARRFGITDIPFTPIGEEVTDLTGAPDLRQILEARREAANHFTALPMKLRKRFRNSPEELWNFLHDPDNRDEAIRLGLITPQTDAPPANSTTSSDSGTPAPAGTSTADASKSTQSTTEKTPKETSASK